MFAGVFLDVIFLMYLFAAAVLEDGTLLDNFVSFVNLKILTK